MFKKTVVVIAVLGAAYVGGSYYVGVRAEEQLAALMNDAQARSNNELAWEQVDIRHGLFTSTGSMELVLKEVKLDDQKPIRARFDYVIDHYLHWARVAHFVWSVTPDKALASEMQPLYPQAPSLTGDGIVDWSGVATSSLAFPGTDNVTTDHGVLSVAPLAGTITVGNNAFDFKLDVPEAVMLEPGRANRAQFKGLSYAARSSDVASGSVAATFLLGDALVIDENGTSNAMSGFRWHFDVVYQQDVLSFDSKKTIASISALGSQAADVEIGFGIDGLHRDDLEALVAFVDQIDGQWLSMSQRQLEQAQQLGLKMLARGFALRVPAVKAGIKLAGQEAPEKVGLEDFGFTVQVTDPKLAIGKLGVTLGSLKVPEMLKSEVPDVDGFRFQINNELTDGRTALTVRKSLGRLVQDGQHVRDVDFDMRLSGLTPEGLLELLDMASDLGGDFTQMSAQQHARLTKIMQDAASHGLVFSVPVLKGTVDTGMGQADSLLLEGLNLEVKLEDVATGAGSGSFVLRNLAADGSQMADIPSLKNYRLDASNRVLDGKADYQIDNSIESFDSAAVKLGPSELSIRLTGLLTTDLQRLSELTPALEAGLSEEQAKELAQIARRAVASGFELSIPNLQLNIDDAKLSGNGKASLAGLGNAPLATFDLARLAQLQAEVDLAGQSPLLDMFAQQGVVLGLLTSNGGGFEGHYQFKDGQLMLNGVAVPAAEFMLMANLMVQQMLANAVQDESDNQTPMRTPRQRRGTNN